jgi:hypothetical protein
MRPGTGAPLSERRAAAPGSGARPRPLPAVGSEPGGPAGPGGPVFWSALVIGWAVIGFAVAGVLWDPWLDGAELALARWAVLTGVAHDALVLPVAAGVGWVLGRVLPAALRGPIRGALAVSAILVAVAYPLLRGFGRRSLNPSALPADYTVSTIIVLALVWLVAAAAVAVRVGRAVRAGPR